MSRILTPPGGGTYTKKCQIRGPGPLLVVEFMHCVRAVVLTYFKVHTSGSCIWRGLCLFHGSYINFGFSEGSAVHTRRTCEVSNSRFFLLIA